MKAYLQMEFWFFFCIPSCVSKGCLGSIQEKTVFPEDWQIEEMFIQSHQESPQHKSNPVYEGLESICLIHESKMAVV